MLIKMNSVSKQYHNNDEVIEVLSGIDLKIDRGDYVSIVGKSGSGKSTLLNILACMDRPTSGEYSINGIDLSNFSESELADIRSQFIGIVFQSFFLLDGLSALENVMKPLLIRGVGVAESEEIARESIRRVGLENRLHHLPNQLSGGQMQRVAIARAIVNSPLLILADEPTGSLDSRTGDDVLELFRELNTCGHAIVLVTHDQIAAGQADRKIEIFDGKIL